MHPHPPRSCLECQPDANKSPLLRGLVPQADWCVCVYVGWSRYQFSCECETGFTGVVCEAADVGTATQGPGTSLEDSVPTRASSSEGEEDPLGGVFHGSAFTSSNAMVISTLVLLVAVVIAACILHMRRKRLHEAVELATVENPAAIREKRRSVLGLLDLEYDEEMPRPHDAQLHLGDYEGEDDDVPYAQGSRPLAFSAARPVAPPPTNKQHKPVASDLATCGECGDEAPIANGSLDEDDMQWYCNTCWRLQDEASNGSHFA